MIEIAPNVASVCKIIDHGKYKYELQKKPATQKNKKIINLKEIKLRPNTDKQYNFKIKAADKFLVKGDKVKFTIRFKGREMEYMEAAHNLIKRIIEDTKKVGKVEQPSKLEGSR